MLLMAAIPPSIPHSLRPKLILAAVIISVAAGGYWLGEIRTAKIFKGILEIQIRSCLAMQYRTRAKTTLRVLNHIHNGQQANASEALERELDQMVVNFGLLWNTDPPRQRDGLNLQAIGEARNYRLQHPWTNSDPSMANRVQEALRLAERGP